MLKSNDTKIDFAANTQYPIHNLLRSRWSPLAFSERAVEPEKLCSVLEAALRGSFIF